MIIGEGICRSEIGSKIPVVFLMEDIESHMRE
jgi:hypothetical protein